jgi:hypothetical protein
MSCCGGRNRGAVLPQSGNPIPPPAPPSLAIFRYDGTTALTVFGQATGRKYWFGHAGAEVAVDMRDRAGLKKVGKLSEVRLA